MIRTIEFLLTNQISLFVIGCLLTIVPATGIMIIHNKKNEEDGRDHN